MSEWCNGGPVPCKTRRSHGIQAFLNWYFESYYTSSFNDYVVLENVLLLYLNVANLLQHDGNNIKNITHPIKIWLKLMIL